MGVAEFQRVICAGIVCEAIKVLKGYRKTFSKVFLNPKQTNLPDKSKFEEKVKFFQKKAEEFLPKKR